MKLWLLTALLLFSPQQSQDDLVLQRLSKVEIFAFGGIGYAGTTSPGEKDFRTVLARKTALADFEVLFASGNIQAKCYALVGIHKLDQRRFEELGKPFADSKDVVESMQGCIMEKTPMKEVLRRIASGGYK